MKMTVEWYREERDAYSGFCKECDDITTGECEPDARNRECPVCEKKTVFGIEEAMMMGLI